MPVFQFMETAQRHVEVGNPLRNSDLRGDILRGGTMNLERRPVSDKEKDEDSAELLDKLRGRLHCGNVSIARRAAYNLSWMQEDGLDILKEALLADSPKATKTAAAYGLRNMRGRMKKMALACLEEGSEQPNRDIRDVCNRALMLLGMKSPEASPSKASGKRGKFKIGEIRTGTARKAESKRPRRKVSDRPSWAQTR